MATLTAMSSSADASAKAAKSRAISAVNAFSDLPLGILIRFCRQCTTSA